MMADGSRTVPAEDRSSCRSCHRPLSDLRDGHARLRPCNCEMCLKCLLGAHVSKGSKSPVCPGCGSRVASHEFLGDCYDNVSVVSGYCSDTGVRRPKRARVERERATKKKRPRRHNPCKVEGCTRHAKRGGLCKGHGARNVSTCSREGCNTYASEPGGLCSRHLGGREDCRIEGCVNLAQKDGLCVKHGGKVIKRKQYCKVEGCETQARKNRPRYCQRDEDLWRGYCQMHYTKLYPPERATCGHEGCEEAANMKGYCKSHFPNLFRQEGEGSGGE